ncbi:dihydrofolate reductase family protein [Ilumatobacter sp.]|uniref:dihydrofolate reductase family protein n=1 Tax=Ilumatobacter sp. TaxID=1967498 RepID=UPI003C4519AA
MRLVISEFITLDGVVQAPGGPDEDTDNGFTHGGWSMPFFDPETMGAAMDTAAHATDVLLFGRRTWQTMAAAWPDRAGDPFADHMNAVPKYVASRTLTQSDLTWNNSTLLPDDDAIGGVRELKQQPGGDIYVMGSSDLARQLVAHDLVDEYLLMIEPVVVGGGKRLFPVDGRLRGLELVEHTLSPTGVHICTYRPT